MYGSEQADLIQDELGNMIGVFMYQRQVYWMIHAELSQSAWNLLSLKWIDEQNTRTLMCVTDVSVVLPIDLTIHFDEYKVESKTKQWKWVSQFDMKFHSSSDN